ITVIVRDDAARPIEYALVQLLCPGAAATALTGRDGQASLAVPKELVEAALLLEARPHGGHYDGSVIRPRLSEREPNVVACRRLTAALPDSGRDDQTGIVGLAPEAELHCLKAMPGGYSSDLIEALDYAIAERLDVVQLSVNCAAPSRLVAKKIEQARQAGVACIAAAGNGTGPVPFPANLPNVLTVAAVGLHGTFPPESRAALEAAGAPVSPEGLFVPAFSNAGPEIDVCAPGVAINSAAPHGSYAALDGTAIAAAHVTAAAALVLAHHPQFRDGRSLQGAERVDHLFALIKSSARRPVFGPFGTTDPAHCGAGIPDAAQCVGSHPSMPTTGPFWAAPPLATSAV
ncbi:MAG TPA: S8 family serine peptidase, partial [Actinocrinis sp.]